MDFDSVIIYIRHIIYTQKQNAINERKILYSKIKRKGSNKGPRKKFSNERRK